MSAALVSYYDMTLERIRERITAAGLSPKTIAAALGVSQAAMRCKLSGETVLTVREIGSLAEMFGCSLSEIVA